MRSDSGPGPPRCLNDFNSHDGFLHASVGSKTVRYEGGIAGAKCTPEARSGSAEGQITPKKIYARLSKTSPYIGMFHYAPSAGNRSRQTYFEKDIVSLDIVRRQHEVRSNPMIGNFHYGEDLYGERFQDFQRLLSSMRAREAERAEETLLLELSRSVVAGERPTSGSFCNGSSINWAGDKGSLDGFGREILGGGNNGGNDRVHVSKVQCQLDDSNDNGSVQTDQSRLVEDVEEENKGSRVGGGAGGEEGSEESGKGEASAKKYASYALHGLGKGAGLRQHRSFINGGGNDKEGREEEERLKLRRKAYAIVVYASGDSLVKLVEKERRSNSSGRFKFAGAIDTSKQYPNSGSMDDCALQQLVAAERSKLYNDLIAEVNGFRRHFLLRQRMHPKEAYRQARRRADADRREPPDLDDTTNASDDLQGSVWGVDLEQDDVEDLVTWQRENMDRERDHRERERDREAGQATSEADYLRPKQHHRPSSLSRLRYDNGAPPFHTLVGPGKRAGSWGKKGHWGGEEEDNPGASWIPGTVSAHQTKESWRSKQEMRDSSKFKPFFVQAKTDFTTTYQLLEDQLLGQGSYASVYLARHRQRGEKVAVKAVQKQLLYSDLEKKSVRAEIENQLRIIHRHVVRLFEVYETPENIFIVLENCPCGDLENMLYVRGHFTEIEAKRVTKQLLDALAYLHSKGIVHGDIKPQNLLFALELDTELSEDTASVGSLRGDAGLIGGGKREEKGSINQQGEESVSLSGEAVTSPAGLLAKLCDFGLSCKVPDARFYKRTGDINKIPWSGMLGTGGFIAPEIIRQEPFGKAADLWSVGVMLYQMISGHMPFMPAKTSLTKPVPFASPVWKNASSLAKDLIRSLLEKDPAHRIDANTALQHPWIQTIQHLRPSFPHFVPAAIPTWISPGNQARARTRSKIGEEMEEDRARDKRSKSTSAIMEY